ncbi:trimeric intracellular cation channel family protein [Candidatus Deferrimicrobium sp.]|uniref:trimeric intracellular cation channel family protein n=1 Tax=Candidatus Deferrimicrobium sp. TaxID=3060586 RepID=UPI002716AFAE|nr:TRIC cation channel family protein [Candidatus Deferrimicrobium sp.]MDO8737820.1 TRIC cation channel family protein [Candidatus Deferrimicrobium sp.]
MNQESLFLLFDLVGTFAFAMSGAFKAIRKNLDLLGILILGFATAMGGGVIRDALLHRTPVAFTTNLYALFALLGCLLAVVWHYIAKGRRFLDEARVFLLVDALGLAIFAVIGASAGAEAGLKPWSVVVLAALTGAGGGAIRDLLVLEIPMMLHADFYATAALLGGLSFVLLSSAGFRRDRKLPEVPCN